MMEKRKSEVPGLVGFPTFYPSRLYSQNGERAGPLPTSHLLVFNLTLIPYMRNS